ncbi:helix-turn-helix transcriptional regulator [Streptococcus oricebi]|uniref:helix-turn-helix transcriptional regulator n=1 Tax=Streptococcus oricebi TaxID=1547447 RepID=UPI001FDA020F|nr:WYL domain-containing protein [Streptococcus oricebi]
MIEKYQISRSTALRDIQSLEAIGMPIYAEYGRYGRYGILKNRLLSPIVFRLDEMYAMYFAMLTLQNYQSTPFDLDLKKLKQKFETCLSPEHQANLSKMSQIFSFAANEQMTESPLLKEIVYAALERSIQDIAYKGGKGSHTYRVQFLKVTSSFGQWYTIAYNYHRAALQVFRCDKILSLSQNESELPLSDERIAELLSKGFKDETAKDFEVIITKKGVDLFLKEHYPSMSLFYKDNKAVVKGYYNQNEEDFIAAYFLAYGKEIENIQPVELKQTLLRKMENNLEYLKTL